MASAGLISGSGVSAHGQARKASFVVELAHAATLQYCHHSLDSVNLHNVDAAISSKDRLFSKECTGDFSLY